MARPIKETPILFGEDARRFEARMKETFISAIQREKFDYTKWHKHFVDTVDGEELDRLCKKNAEEHPFHSSHAKIISYKHQA